MEGSEKVVALGLWIFHDFFYYMNDIYFLFSHQIDDQFDLPSNIFFFSEQKIFHV